MGECFDSRAVDVYKQQLIVEPRCTNNNVSSFSAIFCGLG